MIYLDNAATTKPSTRVQLAVMRSMQSDWGNPSSEHDMGEKAKKALYQAREQICCLIKGATPQDIIFTSGATESNNIALYYGGTTISGSTEHKSVLHNDNIMEAIPAIDGVIRPEATEKVIKHCGEKVDTVSVMLVNNETGAINDVQGISEVARKNEAFVHCDLVQAAGAMPIDVKELGIDAASISGHKLHATKGIGVLYANQRFRRMMESKGCYMSGGAQEYGLRPGTQNVFGAVGLGEACLETSEHLISDMRLYERLNYEMRNNLIMRETNLTFNRWSEDWCNKILSAEFGGIDAGTLQAWLAQKGVCVSTGSACNTRELVVSEALIQSGLTEEQAMSTIRISFSRYNTPHEIKKAAKIIKSTVDALRAIL